MTKNAFIEQLEAIVRSNSSRSEAAALLAEAIRKHGSYRWVGIYELDYAAGLVRNLAWSGPAAPAYPDFSMDKGLTGRAIASRRTVNVPDVTKDADYLTALNSTRSEMIVPVFSSSGGELLGTIDVESEQEAAFDHQSETFFRSCAQAIRGIWDLGLG